MYVFLKNIGNVRVSHHGGAFGNMHPGRFADGHATQLTMFILFVLLAVVHKPGVYKTSKNLEATPKLWAQIG
jgi:hypothetical protein